MRCQMGHEIAPGASYCAHGHPIALDAMPFANDAYGGGGYNPQGGGFGAPPPQQPPPQQQYGGYDPNAQYGGGGGYPPPQQPGGYDPNAQYGGQPGYGQQPPPQQGYGQQPGYPPPQQPPPQYGQQPAPAYGGAPVPQGQPEAAPAPVQLPPNALRGFLVSYQANTQGDFWPLHGGRKTVGRANSGEQVDISLSDATISSRHAAIVVDGTTGSVQVEDTGSTNGTFVNEEHIGFNGRRELQDGDKVRFGGFTTVVKVVSRV